jgi:hypothetical protein
MMHAGHDHGTELPEGEDPTYDPNTNFHIHYQLDIVVNGDQQLIPKGVGNSVGVNSGKFHTHDLSGRIHVHPGPLGRFATVDDFFDMWRDDTVLGNTNAFFTSASILGNVANSTHTVRMYVNGVLNTDFQNYEVHDEDKIVISYEPIANTDFPSFEPIANQNLPAGAPLWLALDGIDPNGGPITYSVSVSNPSGQPNLVTASIPTGNRKIVMDVEGFGKMTFELADDLAPSVVNEIVELINSGFYNRSVINQRSAAPAPATAFRQLVPRRQRLLQRAGSAVHLRRAAGPAPADPRLCRLHAAFVFATGFTARRRGSFQVIREITSTALSQISSSRPAIPPPPGWRQRPADLTTDALTCTTSPGLLAMAVGRQ